MPCKRHLITEMLNNDQTADKPHVLIYSMIFKIAKLISTTDITQSTLI